MTADTRSTYQDGPWPVFGMGSPIPGRPPDTCGNHISEEEYDAEPEKTTAGPGTDPDPGALPAAHWGCGLCGGHVGQFHRLKCLRVW